MKRTSRLQYLPLILASICFAFVTLTPAYLASPVHLVQRVSDYDNYMKLGYAATRRRDYLTALVYFKRSLQLRPRDPYAINAIRNVQSKITFILPYAGTPSHRQEIGGREFDSGEKELIALIPEENPALTTTEYPVLFFYVPQIPMQAMLQLSVLDKSNRKRYSATIATPKTSGIISIALSTIKNLPPLKVGKNYHWYFSIIRDSQNRSTNVLVAGSVQRVKPEPVLANLLKTSSPHERVSIYVENHIWYDALRAVFEARQASPNDLVLVDAWAELLNSVGLNIIGREPLVKCCIVRN